MNEYEKQAQDFLESTGTELTIKYIDFRKYFPDDKEKRAVFEFTLRRGEKEYKGTFGQSLATYDKTPSAYDILACLDYWDGDFEEFCSHYGYDEDSIKALAIYDAIIDQSLGLDEIFDSEELEKLGEIQ